ncbi:MAG: hypothetical protein ACI83H_000278 [Glaciecola sp.]|jgi:hypothetical protein
MSNTSNNPILSIIKLYLCIVLITFASNSEAQISFTESSASQNINVFHSLTEFVGGVAFYDFDNDGWDDITFSSQEGDPVRFFKNNLGSLSLVNLNVPEYNSDTRQINWVDIDNDGDNDLFVVSNSASNRLFLNDGAMNFNDITSASGISMDIMKSWAATWGDYNNDGYLDLFLGNRDFINRTYPNILYRNNGDNTFTNVNSVAGISNANHLTLCASFFDFNNDGWQDIYISNDRINTSNILYKNNGDGTFTDISISSGTNISIDAMSTTIEDYNYDGFLDIYVTNTQAGNSFFKNNGDETFTDVANSNGTIFNSIAWGAVFLDADNDRDQDLYVSGMLDGSTAALPSAFYENSGTGNFAIPSNAGFDNDVAESYSNAIGDINNDGYPDMTVVNNSPDYNFLWINGSSANTNNNWLKVTLEGTTSNRMGVGSWIEIQSDGVFQNRYTICGEGYISQNSGAEFFGLRNSTTIDYVKVTWLSGVEDILYNVSANQKLHIVESSTLSVSENELADNVVVYPNPSKGEITVNTSLENYKINIYNVLGSNVFFKFDLVNNANLDLRHLRSGIYFIKITSLNKEIVKRLIVN